MYNTHVYWYWVHLFHLLPNNSKYKTELFKMMMFEFIDAALDDATGE